MRERRSFSFRNASFTIYCIEFDAVTAEIVHQREVLEAYIAQHPQFATSFVPVNVLPGAPGVAVRMADAARFVGVGPMAGVAGVMAEIAGSAGLSAGAHEVIVENGGDIFMSLTAPATIGVYPGDPKLGTALSFAVESWQTPLAICSSSGRMGHSTSLGECDLATVVSSDTALADAAATRAANMVKSVDDIDRALEEIAAIDGVQGVLIVQDGNVGMVGDLPRLTKTTDDGRLGEPSLPLRG